MLAKGHKELDAAVDALTTGLSKRTTPKDRLRYLTQEWDLRLPTATAILTVLFPDDFTVYDVRVCDVLGAYGSLANRTNFESLWNGYEEFKTAVTRAVPGSMSLRDKDRYLWGQSFALQLEHDIATHFRKPENEGMD